MIIYQLAREYTPYACAGGMKEVVTGLAESYAKHGHSSSAFLPMYGFIDKCSLKRIDSFKIELLNESVNIDVYFKVDNKVNIYFFDYSLLMDKNNVYTYTAEDEVKNIKHKRGMGFADNGKINFILQVAFLKYVADFLEIPDVVNLHDGHTGLIPFIVDSNIEYKNKFKKCRFFFTIHNAGSIYHQKIPVKEVLEYIAFNKADISKAIVGDYLDPLLLASLYSNVITVSPYYAKEITGLKHEKTSDGFGRFCRRNKIVIEGITNGISPEHYKLIGMDSQPSSEQKYKAKTTILNIIKNSSEYRVWGTLNSIDNKPLFLFQNRITEQKGILNLIKAFRCYREKGGIGNLIVMGTGEAYLEDELRTFVQEHKDGVVYIHGYDEKVAMNLFLASDFFLLPSLWEPCGLTDFEAILAGSIPVVNKTGGLQKIVHKKNGFVFNSIRSFYRTILKCDKLYTENDQEIKKMNTHGYDMIADNYTWDHVALKKYLPMFLRS